MSEEEDWFDGVVKEYNEKKRALGLADGSIKTFKAYTDEGIAKLIATSRTDVLALIGERLGGK